jgi:hypothetical protein
MMAAIDPSTVHLLSRLDGTRVPVGPGPPSSVGPAFAANLDKTSAVSVRIVSTASRRVATALSAFIDAERTSRIWFRSRWAANGEKMDIGTRRSPGWSDSFTDAIFDRSGSYLYTNFNLK